MDRKKARPAVLPKRLLRSVAVMNVPIDNQHTIHAMLG